MNIAMTRLCMQLWIQDREEKERKGGSWTRVFQLPHCMRLLKTTRHCLMGLTRISARQALAHWTRSLKAKILNQEIFAQQQYMTTVRNPTRLALCVPHYWRHR